MDESLQYRANRDGNPQTTPAGLVGSLPNRNRNAATQSAGLSAFNGDDTRHLFGPSAQETDLKMSQAAQTGAVVDMEMDFSPDFGNLSDRNNPPSDHPTPSTLNSSSNTSYSITGADDPSPPNKQQKTTSMYSNQVSAPSFDKVNPSNLPLGVTNPQVADLTSMAGGFYQNISDSPSVPTEASNMFPMPSAWDFSTPNPETRNEDFGNLNMESFSESQWAQMLSSQMLSENGTNAGWENWRPS
jgi:hypothetical protein